MRRCVAEGVVGSNLGMLGRFGGARLVFGRDLLHGALID